MENRFGVKDLFLFLLIGAVLAATGLAMWQFDHQFDEVKKIQKDNSNLATDLNAVRGQLNEVLESLDALKRRTAAARPPVATNLVPTATQPSGTQPPAAPQVAETQPATPPTVATTDDAEGDAFTQVRAAEKLPGFARGDWLVDNFSTKVGKLTPLTSSDIYQKWVESQVLESMAVRDPQTLKYVPRLAREWEVSEDGLTMTFRLRRGLRFSDGKPLTAEDVKFTFDWTMNPAVNADRDRAYLTKLKKVTVVDERTVRFEFSELYYLNFETVASTSILSKAFYSRFTPDQFNEKPGLLLGSGPYRLEDPENWVSGEIVVLVRNERYWGTPGTFNRIVFNATEGEAAEATKYKNKEQDLIRCTAEQYRQLSKDPKVLEYSDPREFNSVYKGYSYIGWNQVRTVNGKESNTPFADKRVRQAMTMLTDRERIAREISYGYATVATGPFSPQSKQYNPEVKPWPFDEGRAKALLKDAGYFDRDGDGITDGPDGKPFRFKLTYSSGNETTEKIVLFLKDAYARGGVLMDLDRVQWPVLVQKLNNSDFDAVILGFSSSPESDPFQVFHSSQIVGQGDNRVHYINKELDATIERAQKTMDEGQRMKLWQKCHAILHEDQPNTFLLNRKELHLYNKRIRNIEPATIGLNFDYLNGGMIPWFVPAGQQRYTQ